MHFIRRHRKCFIPSRHLRRSNLGGRANRLLNLAGRFSSAILHQRTNHPYPNKSEHIMSDPSWVVFKFWMRSLRNLSRKFYSALKICYGQPRCKFASHQITVTRGYTTVSQLLLSDEWMKSSEIDCVAGSASFGIFVIASTVSSVTAA